MANGGELGFWSAGFFERDFLAVPINHYVHFVDVFVIGERECSLRPGYQERNAPFTLGQTGE